MNPAQACVEWIVGYQVDWDATAAWVQALGAVAGILWGVWLFRRSEKARMRDQFEYRRSIGRTATMAVRFAADHVRGMHDLVSDPATLLNKLSPVTFDRLAIAEELLRNVPVLETDDQQTLAALAATRLRIAQARRRAEDYNAALNSRAAGRGTQLRDVRRQLLVLNNKLAADAALLEEKHGSALLIDVV